MKHLAYLLLTLSFVLLFSCSDRKSRIDPPQTILTNFETMFGKKTDIRWENPAQDIFQASFTRDGHPTSASFDGQGNWLKTETELLPSEVPAVIISTVAGAFHGRSITRALKIEESNKELIFRLFLKKGRQVSTVDLNTQGVIMINTFR